MVMTGEMQTNTAWFWQHKTKRCYHLNGLLRLRQELTMMP